jgi:hypothetical protein
MPDVNTLVDDYISAWNEADADRRRATVREVFSSDATYLDPVMQGEGHDGLDAMIAAARGRFPGHRFELAGAPDAHHDRLRFTWKLVGPDGGGAVATGYDFATLAGDGRMQAVTGFLEMAA